MVRPMEKTDIPRVAEIVVFGWRCAYRGIVSDEHLFNVRLVTKQIEMLEWVLTNTEPYVYDDGIIKGFITMGPSDNEDKPDAFELGAIYVEQFFKRQGIGAKMALFCEEKAIERGYKEI